MIEIRSSNEIKNIRIAGKIIRKALTALSKIAAAGISTERLDAIAEDIILREGAKTAFKGYMGFPNTICTSINDSVVHEIPSRKRILKNGDIISFDVGAGYNGYYADSALTIGIGEISAGARKLIDISEKALYIGIDKASEGNRVSDISHAIQVFVESNGFNVVRAFVGHGIGRKIHEEPEIPNFGEPNKGARLKEGMIFAIEPMVSEGAGDIKI
ncbi:MAG: type I methionyl aminopeptidase, partial [Candidatus Omnitrophica bacterium]|nr:type I methionyl aminopeptidase [Candidatus Omnitrophota bacterium]